MAARKLLTLFTSSNQRPVADRPCSAACVRVQSRVKADLLPVK